MKIMKSVNVKLEKDFVTPFGYTFKSKFQYKADLDGNGTVTISFLTEDTKVSAYFVKGTNIIIL